MHECVFASVCVVCVCVCVRACVCACVRACMRAHVSEAFLTNITEQQKIEDSLACAKYMFSYCTSYRRCVYTCVFYRMCSRIVQLTADVYTYVFFTEYVLSLYDLPYTYVFFTECVLALYDLP